MGRKILATLAGLVIGGAMIAMLEAVSHSMFDTGNAPDPSDADAYNLFVEGLPIGALLSIPIIYLIGTLVGGFAASKLVKSQTSIPTWVCGILFSLAAANAVVQFPGPIWQSILMIVAPIAGALIGHKLASREI